jgi:hypothetical protein
MGWTGPTEIRGFVLADRQGRHRVAFEHAALNRGLWALAWNAQDFGELTLQSPSITIWPDQPSPLLPPGPDEPDEPEEPGPLPEPIGNITLRNATVTVVRGDGRRYTLGPIKATITLRTLNEIAADIDIATPRGGTVRIAADLRELVRNGRLDPLAASGSASIRTVDGNVAVAPLAALADANSELTGGLVLRADATFEGGSAELQWSFDGSAVRPDGKQAAAGSASGQTSLTRRADGAVTVSSADAELTGLTLAGRRIGDKPFMLTIRRAMRAPDGRTTIGMARLAGPPGQVMLTDARFTLGRRFELAGQFSAEADLRQTARLIVPLTGRRKPPAIDGSLTWDARVLAAEDGFRLTGGGRVEQLRVGTGERTVSRKLVKLDHEAFIARDWSELVLRTFELTAPQLLTARIDGRVSELRSRRVANLSGEYTAWWDAVDAILTELAPQAVEHVAFTGQSSGPLRIRGPLHQATAQPVFKGASGRTQLGWKSAKVYGLPLETATLEARLEKGILRLPVREISSGDGKLRLGGTVDFTGEVPVYRLDGKVRPLEKVALTQPLMRELVGRFNPVFMQVAGVSGTISLDTEDLVLPLGERAMQTGSGSGRLDLSKTRLVPQGLLGKLIPPRYLKADGALPVQVGTLDFALRDGRIHYQDLDMTFPGRFSLGFSGSVGLDGTLDLAVGVPVNSGVLTELGLGGKAGRYADLLDGVVIRIPLRGTRTNPKLDFSSVDVEALVEQVSKDFLRNKAGDLLRDLLEDDDEEDAEDADGDGSNAKDGGAKADDGDDGNDDKPEATTRPTRRKPSTAETIFEIIRILRDNDDADEDGNEPQQD